MLDFLKSSHVIFTMTSYCVFGWQYVLKCWVASLRVKTNPNFGFQMTPGTAEKEVFFKSWGDESETQKDKTEP